MGCLAEERRCEGCGAVLSEEDVMKVQLEDGSWETVPLPLCPKCFKESLMRIAEKERRGESRAH
ncbi:hypothetical protein KEJ33_04780 [Candidatus Bathyarchaeota archaeon]|nr:hypothetical protein [Candidatus Bathyarchaeota archaeon]